MIELFLKFTRFFNPTINFSSKWQSFTYQIITLNRINKITWKFVYKEEEKASGKRVTFRRKCVNRASIDNKDEKNTYKNNTKKNE